MTNNTFEEKLKSLENTVRKLEENDLSLDQSKELYKEGYSKSEILRMIIKEFQLDRDLNSRSWPKWLIDIE